MFQITIPFGCQNGEPGEMSSRWKRSSCRPSTRWSRARASSTAGEVRRQVVRRVEGRAVDPGQLRVLLVAAPVRTREPGELDRLDRLRILQMRAAAEIGEVALRVQRDVPFGTCRRARPCTARLRPRSAPAPPPARSPRATTTAPPPAPCRSRPRSARGRTRGSARGTRSRSRSRSRSAARSRSSRPGTAAAPPRRAGGRSSGAAHRGRPGRPCRAWSGSGSARRPRAARAGRGPHRSSGRPPPARRASGPMDARRVEARCAVGEFELRPVG